MADFRTWFGAEKIGDREADRAAMDNDPRFLMTEYLVEATSFEHHAQWCFRARGAPYCYDVRDMRTVDWVQTNPGLWEQVGKLADMPVVVNLSWAWLNGAMVCFYESTSQVVDWRMIEAWLGKKFPNVRLKTDAINLHNVLLDIEQAARKAG